MRYLIVLLWISMFSTPLAAMSLIQAGDATHTAVSDGPWHQASTWDNGVPGAGDLALIPDGVAVTIDGGSAQVEQLLIQGTLTFATSQTKDMLVDTIEVGPMGALYIGSVAAPMAEDAQVEISFVSDSSVCRCSWGRTSKHSSVISSSPGATLSSAALLTWQIIHR